MLNQKIEFLFVLNFVLKCKSHHFVLRKEGSHFSVFMNNPFDINEQEHHSNDLMYGVLNTGYWPFQ